jgi:hypothetical protein
MKNKFQVLKIVVSLILLNISTMSYSSFHLWDLSEVYSDESGDVLYIELFCAVNGQQFLINHDLIVTSDSNSVTFTFPSNSGSPTAGQFLLLATSNFASIPGAVTPDFILPNNFFDRTATSIELNFGPGQDVITVAGTDIPSDGTTSLDLIPAIPVQIANSPTNFAGDIGNVNIQSGVIFSNGFED